MDSHGLVDFKVILFGEKKYCDFYNPFFSKNNIESVIYEGAKPEDLKNITFGVLYPKEDIHSTEDIVKEIRTRFGENFKILPIVEKKSYYILETMFLSGVERICFDFKPEKVLEELINYYKVYVEKSNNVKPGSNYIINFYENKGTFFIDISGELKKEKLMALKLMFSNYLTNKLSRLRGIVYIFNNTDDSSVNFQNIWALFRFWKAINFNYNNISYLTNSPLIETKLQKYVGHLGVKHHPNLLDVVKNLYPEISKGNEIEIFEFASDLLQTDIKKSYK